MKKTRVVTDHRMYVKQWRDARRRAYVYLTLTVKDGRRLVWTRDGMFGRAWGWVVDSPFLKKEAEVCYYRDFYTQVASTQMDDGSVVLRALILPDGTRLPIRAERGRKVTASDRLRASRRPLGRLVRHSKIHIAVLSWRR